MIADGRVGAHVKLRPCAIPERFWGDDSQRGAILSVRTFTFTSAYVLSPKSQCY